MWSNIQFELSNYLNAFWFIYEISLERNGDNHSMSVDRPSKPIIRKGSIVLEKKSDLLKVGI